MGANVLPAMQSIEGEGEGLEEGVHLAELGGCAGGGDSSEGWRMGSEDCGGDPAKI